jgi:hypothetical protein
MFSFSRGRKGPHIIFIRDSDGPIRLEEARLVAWARALGQVRESVEAPVRPHRGQLADVDFSRVERVERRPGLLSRAARAIFARKAAPAADVVSGAAKAGIGKPAP